MWRGHHAMPKHPTIDILTLLDTDGRRYVDLQLRPAELEAVGRVATSWAFLDLMICTQSRGIAIALGERAPPDDVEATAFKKRRAAWIALAKRFCASDQYAAFRLLAEKASALAHERNGVIHDIMSIHPTDTNRLRALPIPGKGQFGRPLNVGQINHLAREIAKLSHAVLVFFGDSYIPHGASLRRRDTPDRTHPAPSRASRGRPPAKVG
jgi:hypothetical protein